MSAVESWPFCPTCGTILNPPVSSDEVKCSFCPFKCNFMEVASEEVITTSASSAKPAWVDIDQDQDTETMQKHAVIDEPCPKCAHHQLYFYTMQLRSVDEGSTVFYECPNCNHKFSQNN
jgi:DNA-directed RNA polymerase I subunit RPA12